MTVILLVVGGVLLYGLLACITYAAVMRVVFHLDWDDNSLESVPAFVISLVFPFTWTLGIGFILAFIMCTGLYLIGTLLRIDKALTWLMSVVNRKEV